MVRDTWTGTCEWCGEPDVTLTCNQTLPDWTEGVACLECEKMMLEEADRAQRVEHEAEMDVLEGIILSTVNAHKSEAD